MTDLSNHPPSSRPLRAGFSGFLRTYYIYFVLVAVVAVLSLANLDQFALFERGNFLNKRNIFNILRVSAPLLMLAGAFTLLMVSGYIDLSVGSTMSLSAVVYALLAINGVPFLACFGLTVLAGIGLGAVNGFLVVRLKITPVIATLITLSLFKGIALLLVQDGVSAIKSIGEQRMPGWFNDYEPRCGAAWPADGLLGGGRRDAGADLRAEQDASGQVCRGDRRQPGGGQAIGDQHQPRGLWPLHAGRCSTAALAGIARSSFMSLGDPLSGDGMELSAILVVLIGGTAFSGGEGRVLRSFVGALIIMALTVGMLTLVPAYYQTLVIGAALLAAAASNHLISRKEGMA
ncbi:ABC transporter permease [Ponticoccus litoralis]|uniref:ABC transporter permease n=1 Tax=Ponticoccus litoralis TaxID=422297 RepID=A0AAW9SWA2_9RHOB